MSGYSLQHFTDFVARYGGLLLQRMRKPRNDAFLAAVIAETQAFEDAVIGVQRGIDIDTGVGAGLDLIGKLLRVPRYGATDDDYRLRLKVEVIVLRSRGTPEDLCAIVSTLWSGTFVLRETDYATTVIELTSAVGDTAFPRKLLAFLKRGKAEGTRVLLVFHTSTSRVFRFAPGAAFAMDAAHGMGDSTDPSNPAVGGLLSSVIE